MFNFQKSFFLEFVHFVLACPFDPGCKILCSKEGLIKAGKSNDPDLLIFLTSFESVNQRGVFVSVYLTRRSAGLVGLEMEK